jgi:hypothetical protein
MKKTLAIPAALLALTALVCGQTNGYWTPRGAPLTDEGQMKTLDQIEPRQAITELPFMIVESGSYYLVGSLDGQNGEHGIMVGSSDVKLDLNGFSINGVPGSLDGIKVMGQLENISIRHGVIRGWGGSGIDALTAYECTFVDIKASGNGNAGIIAGENSLIDGCGAYWNGHDPSGATYDAGIFAGLYSTIKECKSRMNSGSGFYADMGTRITGCTATENQKDGIHAMDFCTIVECLVTHNGWDGITVWSNCRVEDNNSSENGYSYWDETLEQWVDGNGAGIRVLGQANRIEDNSVSGNDWGIDVWWDQSGYTAEANLIIRNSASGNTFDYDMATTDYFGGILNTNNITGGTDGFIDTNPWSNFTF